MSRSLGAALPAPLVTLLDGQRVPEKTTLALLLATASERGHPHPAMLSVGEVLATGPSTLRLALYANSSTSANLRRRGAFSIALAHADLAYYVKATATERSADRPELAGLAVFDATVDEVLEDGEPIARVTSGFAIELTQGADRTIERWESTLAALQSLS